MTDDEIRRRRLAGQALHPRATGPVTAVVAAVGALQAQVPAAAALAVRARSTGLGARDVAAALERERSVVRSWAHRGTLQIVPSEDLGWLLGLIGPPMIAAHARRHRELGVDAAGIDVVEAVLADGPLARAAVAERLAARGIDAAGQRTYAHLHRAGLEGRVCAAGGDRFARTADWLGAAPEPAADPDAALAELARRHLAAHGPAGPLDLAHWSGIRVPDARRAFALIAGELTEVASAGAPAWLLAAASPLPPVSGPEPVVSLLGAFDAILLGHRDRSLVLPREHRRRVQAGGGWLHPVVLADGRAVATWTRGPTGAVAVAPFEPPLDPALSDGLAAELADLERFGR